MDTVPGSYGIINVVNGQPDTPNQGYGVNQTPPVICNGTDVVTVSFTQKIFGGIITITQHIQIPIKLPKLLISNPPQSAEEVLDSSMNHQQHTHKPSIENPKKWNNTTLNIGMIIFGAIIVLICALVVSFLLPSQYHPSDLHPGTYDMTKAENRDFNKYYGIIDSTNPFTISTADACNQNTRMVFKPAFPSIVLKSDESASSFMILAKYGTGKTLLRCEYFKYLNSNNYFKILILNKDINEYLERFVSQTSKNGVNCAGENCLTGWSKNEFGQLLLSILVTQFIDSFNNEPFNFPDISFSEKIQIITILCYYYNEQGVIKLENFINSFLKKTDDSKYNANAVNVQIKQRGIYEDKPLLISLKNNLEKLSIVRKEEKRFRLLLAIAEGEKFENKLYEKKMFDNIFDDLTHFTIFMKERLKKRVVFIIDGIDENQYFFQNNAVQKTSLELFYLSSISQEILTNAMVGNFYLSLFYPKINGIDIIDNNILPGKFPIYSIDWNKYSIINYADYILQQMSENALPTHCKLFTDFRTLVNYNDARIAYIIDQIETPRALHYFMIDLILEMDKSANNVKEPFIATFENVEAVYNKSKEHFHRRNTSEE